MTKIVPNAFKATLKNNETQIGLWLGMANSYSAEMVATVGYDWLLIDAEHAPNNVKTVLQQLQALAPYQMQGFSHPVVRPPIGDVALIKQYLDVGVQTLLIPMVESAEQAQTLVDAMRYPPEGIRGVGSALARASLWNSVEDYLNKANDEMCLLVQVENLAGLNNIEEIVALEGIDGVFIGPADLSASMGHRGNPSHPEVQAAIAKTVKIVREAGKAAGILYADPKQAQAYIDMGFNFVAVGVDTTLLVKACRQLLGQFKVSEKPVDLKPSVY
ncbi:4-hydroxy-2-oxoheptanedioate aldolase [Wohlfahrtiimonas chitiniclastica]|uniref:4-hydroxy-2-oxoheptanedioate aldolase n=1 Tax=Wohlfahrtiimonas chitiniclastica TaxID=400946 RepID=UPI001BCDFF7D|nr:4-hydroxy-2-oxoheptanedioate aldolase [Wohlfahrtiimonas chitiniclastica]MBS7838424.1 4-hydroxy-2-oxoheptanedioate aldolase [Wohlfahrtiimonas chitiniclastica]